MKYWLLKTEPNSFGIEHLEALPEQTTGWEGVRNYQARNFMRDEMAEGDLGFLYHSSCSEPGIVGIVKVTRRAYPDDTAFDPTSQYFDQKSSQEQPTWFRVDVTLVQKLETKISLKELRSIPALRHFCLLQKGNRLSVMPVTHAEWKSICELRKMTCF